MIDAEERQQLINAMLDKLEHGNAAERRAAAYWLGEAAAGDAVDELIKTYHDDDNKSVRAAAAYALGMFRAVDKALKAGREEQVVERLRQVEEEGKLGGRAPVGRWMRRIFGLLLSLLIIGGLYLVRDNLRVLVFPSLAQDRLSLVSSLQQQFTPIKNDVTTLQNQFVNVVINGGQLDCTAFFNEPPPVAALSNVDSLAYADLAAMVTRMNGVHDSLLATKAVYNEACFGSTPLTRESAGEVYRDFVPTITTIGELETALNVTLQNAPTATPEPPTAAPVTETPLPPTPEPTNAAPTSAPIEATSAPQIDPTAAAQANPGRHVGNLYVIVETATGLNGPSSLLLRYWTDVKQSGDTGGCTAPAPAIPENYTVLPEIDLQVSVQLRQAVTLINNGLGALRSGWHDFQTACTNGTLAASADNGYNWALNTQTSFQSARPLLDIVRAQWP